MNSKPKPRLLSDQIYPPPTHPLYLSMQPQPVIVSRKVYRFGPPSGLLPLPFRGSNLKPRASFLFPSSSLAPLLSICLAISSLSSLFPLPVFHLLSPPSSFLLATTVFLASCSPASGCPLSGKWLLIEKDPLQACREEVAVVAESIPVLGEKMDTNTALQLVLRKALAHGGLVCGLHEVAKALEKHNAQLCVLAEDCDQPDYVKLVKALCADHNISLMTVPAAKTLGEWAGLCKIDSEGKARKVVGCSCVVVKDYGEETEARHVLIEHLKA